MPQLLHPRTTFLDYPDNESLSVIMFMTGCDNNCVECHSPMMMEEDKFDDDERWLHTKETSVEVIASRLNAIMVRNKTNKLVLSGGDPLYKRNIAFTQELCETLMTEYNAEICIYTGHSIDYVTRNKINCFSFVKCGKYTPDLKQLSKKSDDKFVLASTNQNFFDINYKQLSTDGILKLN